MLVILNTTFKNLFVNELKKLEKYFYYIICHHFFMCKLNKQQMPSVGISINFFQILLENCREIKDKPLLDISKEEGFSLEFLKPFQYLSIKMSEDFFDIADETFLNLENDLKAIVHYIRGLYFLIKSNEKEAIQSFEQSLKIKKVCFI